VVGTTDHPRRDAAVYANSLDGGTNSHGSRGYFPIVGAAVVADDLSAAAVAAEKLPGEGKPSAA
jgi:hypothetical protein